MSENCFHEKYIYRLAIPRTPASEYIQTDGSFMVGNLSPRKIKLVMLIYIKLLIIVHIIYRETFYHHNISFIAFS